MEHKKFPTAAAFFSSCSFHRWCAGSSGTFAEASFDKTMVIFAHTGIYTTPVVVIFTRFI